MLLGACVTNDRRHEGATHASHGRPWMVAQGLRGAGTAQRNAAVGASLVRQAPGGYPRKNALICAANAGGAASNGSSPSAAVLTSKRCCLAAFRRSVDGTPANTRRLTSSGREAASSRATSAPY